MPIVTKLAAAGLLCAGLALTGCSGGASDLAGTWKGTDSNGTHDTLQLVDDGTASITSGDEGSCKGKLDTDSEPYKLSFDCGIAKGVATVKQSGDNKLDLTLTGEETEVFTKSGG